MSCSPTRDLLKAWRADPHSLATVRVCRALLASSDLDGELAVAIADEATRLHGEDVPVLVAVGHMHLAAGELARAKATLLQAAKIAPEELAAFRVLGEVLLRAGDFVGFERVLRHAAVLRRNLASVERMR